MRSQLSSLALSSSDDCVGREHYPLRSVYLDSFCLLPVIRVRELTQTYLGITSPLYILWLSQALCLEINLLLYHLGGRVSHGAILWHE